MLAVAKGDGLEVAPGLVLPANTDTQRLAVIGQSGSGKTYAAGKIVEELLRLRRQVVVIDIVGNWWALTVAADGKGRGFEIPVFGGDHGDVPIVPTQGAAVAALIMTRRLPAVLDVSLFRKAERDRFIAEFCEDVFYRARTAMQPMMIVYEEAQRLVPERARDGERRMLGAVEDLVRIGRNYRVGSLLISQRPQSINKEVLNQTQALFVGQLAGHHERKAIDLWIQEAEDADRSWLRELPTLQPGTMHVWSPQWLRLRTKVTISRKITYDASAALEGASVTRPALGTFDVGELRAALEAPADGKGRAKRPRGGVAQGPLRALNAPAPVPDRSLHLQAENAELQARVAELEGQRDQERAARVEILAQVRSAHLALGELLSQAIAAERAPEPAPMRPRTRANLLSSPAAAMRAGAREHLPSEGEGDLRAGARRMLQALAEFYPGKVTKPQAARLGRTKISGGTFKRYWATLIGQGYIEETDTGFFRASRTGLAVLGVKPPAAGQSFEERRDMWTARLRAGERAILEAVLSAGKRGISAAQVAELVGQTMSGGTFKRYVATLVTNRLVERRGQLLLPHAYLLGGE